MICSLGLPMNFAQVELTSRYRPSRSFAKMASDVPSRMASRMPTLPGCDAPDPVSSCLSIPVQLQLAYEVERRCPSPGRTLELTLEASCGGVTILSGPPPLVKPEGTRISVPRTRYT